MDPERSRLIDRLRKIRAMANSANPHESDTAHRLVGDFMTRHGLTDHDLKAHDDAAYYELSLGTGGFNAVWKFALATLAARSYECEAIALNQGKKRKVRLVGAKIKVEKSASFFQVLLKILKDLERREADELSCRAELELTATPRQCADSFRRGAVTGMAEILMRGREQREQREKREKRQSQSPPTPSHSPTSTPHPCASPTRALIPLTSLASREKASPRDHFEKVKEKYAPTTKPLELGDADSKRWYLYGYLAAQRHVELSDVDTSSDSM